MTSSLKLPTICVTAEPTQVRFYQKAQNPRDSRLPFLNLTSATLTPLEHGLIVLAPSKDTSGKIVSDLGGWKIVELTSRLCHLTLGSSLDPMSKSPQRATQIRVKFALDRGQPSLISLGFAHLDGKFESLDGGVRFKADDGLQIILDSEGLRINHSPSNLDPNSVISAIMESRLSVAGLRSSLML